MAEMEVDLNMKYDWSSICETGEKLEQVRGPGFIELLNIFMSFLFTRLVHSRTFVYTILFRTIVSRQATPLFPLVPGDFPI